MKNLEYLDLTIKGESRNNKTTGEGHHLICNFGNNFNHILHSEDRHINSLVDLLINLSIEQQKQFKLLNEEILNQRKY